MEAKARTRDRVDQELDSKIQLDTRSPAEKLVLACRMLGARGHWHGGLAGQITARGEQPGTYWTLKFGIGADEATPEDRRRYAPGVLERGASLCFIVNKAAWDGLPAL